jgi:hypothetical protein
MSLSLLHLTVSRWLSYDVPSAGLEAVNVYTTLP